MGIRDRLYYVLVLLTKFRALDKVQVSGEGEGAMAWRELQDQWEPKSRSRYTSMLLGILNASFKGDAQSDIESWERDLRLFEKQTAYQIPEFIKAGILINGTSDETLKNHMIMHTKRLDTYDKLKDEVLEIARAKSSMSTSTHQAMDVDALGYKGKKGGKGGKGDGKGKKGGKTGGKGDGKGKKGKDDKETTCFYCEKKGHRKNDCRKRLQDLEKAKQDGRPNTAARAVNELQQESLGSSISQASTAPVS